MPGPATPWRAIALGIGGGLLLFAAALLLAIVTRNVPEADAICTTCFATLTIDLSGEGEGVVTSEDGYINCTLSGGAVTGTCAHTYPVPSGTVDVTLHQTAQTGSYACYENVPCIDDPPSNVVPISFSMSTTWHGYFGRTQVIVYITVAGGAGTITSDPGGVACTSTCTATAPYGLPMTFNAVPSAAFAFHHWAGACGSEITATCTTTPVDPSTSVIGYFVPLPTPTPTPAPTPGPGATPAPTPAASQAGGGATSAPTRPSPTVRPQPTATPVSGGGVAATSGPSPLATTGTVPTGSLNDGAGGGPASSNGPGQSPSAGRGPLESPGHIAQIQGTSDVNVLLLVTAVILGLLLSAILGGAIAYYVMRGRRTGGPNTPGP